MSGAGPDAHLSLLIGVYALLEFLPSGRDTTPTRGARSRLAFAVRVAVFAALPLAAALGGRWSPEIIAAAVVVMAARAATEALRLWLKLGRRRRFAAEALNVAVWGVGLLALERELAPAEIHLPAGWARELMGWAFLALPTAGALALVTRGSTVLVRALLDDHPTPGVGRTIEEPELRVGRMIGNLERVLLASLAYLGEFGAIGFVLAAKSVARFKALEDRGFAEYYLLGTLLSSLLAIGLGRLAWALGW